MSKRDAATILDELEANDRAGAYKARWDEPTARRVVPELVRLADDPRRDVLLRTLHLLGTIGPSASAAAERIRPHLRSADAVVAAAAVWTLGRVSLDRPDVAIDALMGAVEDVPGLARPAMHALIDFGTAAHRAAPLYVAAFADPSADVRRLALRGLAEIGAEPAILAPILRRAVKDRSERVRAYAAKKFPGGDHL